jgi:hypothetical protein
MRKTRLVNIQQTYKVISLFYESLEYISCYSISDHDDEDVEASQVITVNPSKGSRKRAKRDTNDQGTAQSNTSAKRLKPTFTSSSSKDDAKNSIGEYSANIQGNLIVL